VHAAGLTPASDCAVSSFSSSSSAKKGYDEIACTINSRRNDIPLERLLNFLYLLSQESRLHSVTSLSITPQADGNSVAFSLRYATLVLDEKLPVSGIRPRDPATTQPALVADLSDARRGLYDVVTKRNMFLPYVPQPKVEPVAAAPPQAQGEQPPPPPPPPRPAPVQPVDQLVLTGLPRAGAVQEVHVSNPGGHVQKVHKIGDNMGGVGDIVMVDYRPMPMPNEPKKISASRMILKIGQSFWAVELGQQIGQRRVLGQEVLPEELKAPPASQPAQPQPAAGDSARADAAKAVKDAKSN
jgi:hypothetical protein